MPTLDEVQLLTYEFSQSTDYLSELVLDMKEAIEEVRDRHYPKIREVAKIVANNQSTLMIAIGKSPEIFIKPKTMVLHGVKGGFQKGKRSYVFDDEERVINNITEQSSP